MTIVVVVVEVEVVVVVEGIKTGEVWFLAVVVRGRTSRMGLLVSLFSITISARVF